MHEALFLLVLVLLLHLRRHIIPDIVYSGMDVKKMWQESIKKKIHSCRALIVMGTSLKVAPVNQLPGESGLLTAMFCAHKHQVRACNSTTTCVPARENGVMSSLVSYLGCGYYVGAVDDSMSTVNRKEAVPRLVMDKNGWVFNSQEALTQGGFDENFPR